MGTLEPIHLQTRISDLLRDYPALEEVFFGLSPQFEKLKNPILRRTVTKVTSVQQAASIAGLEPDYVLRMLRKAADLPLDENAVERVAASLEAKPGWVSADIRWIELDVRTDLSAGRSPMKRILEQAAQLKTGEGLCLLNEFVPAPILDQLKRQGCRVWVEQRETVCCAYIIASS
ncbi:MAG: DUF1858 domain-containing protein [Bacteroidales bacterium]|jgi:hypothetical protein|nr:DUF1858 domain-containing protein [Bacteroidales bacterium]MDD4769954.1 DUF1858 domain-containing protein [Bacteroidales bacterium]HKL91888.1 DUF1858 domain-containing protein [Bacteroidales bacterium]